jgi:glycosyltransferase involved in cell wall biosynthesis
MLLEKKKVAIVCYTGNSGLTDYSVSLARALSKDCEVVLITGRNATNYYQKFQFDIIKLFGRSRRYPLDVVRLFFYLLKIKPDVVLFQSWLKFPVADALLVALLRFVGIDTAVTIHDVLPHYPKRWSRYELSLYYRLFNKVIVHSEVAKVQVANMGVINPILVVPHGIYDLFDTKGLDKIGARGLVPGVDVNDFVVLFFGRITPRKGINLFLRLAARFVDQKDCKFIVAGFNGMKDASFDDVAEYEALVRGENVILKDGRVPFQDVQIYFSASDVVVLPYVEGTTSGVIKLALAFKRPVVATNVGDISETLIFKFGELVEVNADVCDGLYDALETVRGDYESYHANAYDACEYFSWERISIKYREHILLG